MEFILTRFDCINGKITTTLSVKAGYISQGVRGEANLPGTGDTVIKQAVPPGGDLALHLALLKPAIAQIGDSGAKFLVGGYCVRTSPAVCKIQKSNSYTMYVSMSV